MRLPIFQTDTGAYSSRLLLRSAVRRALDAPSDCARVAVRVEDPALAAQRTGRDLSHRVDHHAIAGVHPLLRIGIDLLAAWQPGRHVAPLDAIGGSRHPAACLAGDVLHGGQPAFAVVP